MGPCFVSVIIPVYNDQPGINACLQALDLQTWPKDCYEVIVIDNKSDPPIKIDPSLNSNIRLITCLKPGSYAARNAGISESQGEVLAFTDADCLPDPDWIRAGVAALNKNRGNYIIGGEVKLSLSSKPTAVELYQYLNGFMQRENIEERGFSATANMFCTHSQAHDTGNFNEMLLSGGDREWCWRAADIGFPTKYDQKVKVTSHPRRSIAEGIRQVRRVAGGRQKLCKMETKHVNPSNIKPHRTGWAAAKWILTHPDLSFVNRARVFGVAVILKFTKDIERIRLSCGTKEERG